MRTIPDIFKCLGGATKIAAGTGIPLTTVHSWKRARFVPEWRRPALVAFAKQIGVPLGEADFPTKRPAPEPTEAEAA